jgi:hypothetical protein
MSQLEVKERIVAVHFRKIPEIPSDVAALTRVFDTIHRRQIARTEQRSFGALLVRQASEELVTTCIGLLGATDPKRKVSDPDPFGSLKGSGSLHTDRGKPNSITLHHTISGSCNAIVLPEARFLNPASGTLLTHRLHSSSAVDLQYISLPPRPLQETLGSNDLLIFDHTQPHAFSSLTDDRKSLAHYLA